MFRKFLIVSLVICQSVCLFGQNSTLDTPLQPVVISGSNVPEFSGVSTGDLFLYAYSEGSWHVIPFQIDERSTNNRYTEPDSIVGLDDNDEIVFMAKDAGDKADGTWIASAESRAYPRYEFKVIGSAGGEAWVYLYRIPANQPELNPLNYIEYIAAPEGTVVDTIFAEGVYKVGSAANGFPGSLSVYDGGTGVDILSRQQIEIQVNLGIGNATLNDEDNFFPKSVSVRDDKIRVIRELTADIRIAFFGDTIDVILDLVFPITHYSTFYEIKAPDLEITPDLFESLPVDGKIIRIRQAFLLNNNAIGVSFFNAANSGGITIDGIPDSPNPSVVTSSEGVNRFLFKGSQANFLTEYVIPEIGDNQSLFYQDNSSGETPIHAAGFEITGEEILGEAPLGLTVVFPGPVADGSEADYISTEHRELSIETASQNYDEVTSVALAESAVPEEFNLAQNYPNPFNPSTLIQYSVPRTSDVNITVYNLLGQEIVTLVNQEHLQGNHSITWNGMDRFGNEVAAGVYIYRLKTEGIVQTRKMLLIK